MDRSRRNIRPKIVPTALLELIESVPGSRRGSAVEAGREAGQVALEGDVDEASRRFYHDTCLAAQEAIRVAQEQVSLCIAT